MFNNNNNHNHFAFQRHFFYISADKISHTYSTDYVKTFPGISKYHCFRITKSKKVHYTTYSCHCNHYLCGSWLLSTNSKICCIWNTHTWKFKNTINHNKYYNHNNHSNNNQTLIGIPPPLTSSHNLNNHNVTRLTAYNHQTFRYHPYRR